MCGGLFFVWFVLLLLFLGILFVWFEGCLFGRGCACFVLILLLFVGELRVVVLVVHLFLNHKNKTTDMPQEEESQCFGEMQTN